MNPNTNPETTTRRDRLQDYDIESCLLMLKGLGVVVGNLDEEISNMGYGPLNALGDAIEVYAIQADDQFQKMVVLDRDKYEALKRENETLRNARAMYRVARPDEVRRAKRGTVAKRSRK